MDLTTFISTYSIIMSVNNLTCTLCNYTARSNQHIKMHMVTQQHINQLCQLPKDTPLTCPKCVLYITTQKCHFRRHTASCHGPKNDSTDCPICHKRFQTKSGLRYHAKKCLPPTTNTTDPLIGALPAVIESLTQQIGKLNSNQELQTTVLEQLVTEFKASVVNNTIINGNVHQGDTMTLNVFLNEKCKDAMNILDFIRSIPMKQDMLDMFVNKGYVGAMSNIMVNELNKLPLTQRPLHCTDIHRQTLHVKHQDKWHKETKDAPVLLTAIRTLQSRCSHLIHQRYPPGTNRYEPESVQEALYFKTHQELSGGPRATDEVFNKRNLKIVSHVCRDMKLSKNDMLTV